MSFRAFVRRLAESARRGSPMNARTCKARPVVELLEDRMVPYSVTGNAWPHASLITISFMPDGTNLGGSVVSNLQSTFNNNAYLGQSGRRDRLPNHYPGSAKFRSS